MNVVVSFIPNPGLNIHFLSSPSGMALPIHPSSYARGPGSEDAPHLLCLLGKGPSGFHRDLLRGVRFYNCF